MFEESGFMKRICLFVIVFVLALFVKPCFAVSYGDLYDIEWCPCDPSEPFNDNGSVVLGKTVMCPCQTMYDGYGRTFYKDVEKAKHVAQKVMKKASNYKYYVGVEFNKSTAETTEDRINFERLEFINPVSVKANDVIADQDNIGIVIGTRPHPNIGVEAFYNRTFSDNKVIHADLNALASSQFHVVNTYISKYQAFGVDIIGYLPLTDYFDFVAFVGLGQYYFDNEVVHNVADVVGGTGSGNPYFDTLSSEFNDDTLAWRVGGGIQFNIARGLILRGMYRYISINSTTIKNLQEFSVGVRFLF